MSKPIVLNNKLQTTCLLYSCAKKDKCPSCIERTVCLWLKDHFGTGSHVVIKRKDSPQTLIKRLATTCCKALSASNWCVVAKVCYSRKGEGYLEETMEYLKKGLKIDPYHMDLVKLKDVVSSQMLEENERVALFFNDSSEPIINSCSNPFKKASASGPIDPNRTKIHLGKEKQGVSSKGPASDHSKRTSNRETEKPKEKIKSERLIYENILKEADPEKRMAKAKSALKMIKKIGVSNNPLRLYYMAELREIGEIVDPLEYENSVFYIELFFACADEVFFKEYPDLYLSSNLLIMKIYLNLIYRFIEKDMDKVFTYQEKLRQRVDLIAKQPRIEEGDTLKTIVEELTGDIDFLPLKMLMVKMHREEGLGKEILLTNFIKIFPQDISKIHNKEMQLNAGIIFYQQSKNSENKKTKEKYLEKAFHLFKAVLTKDPDNHDFQLIFSQVLIDLIEITEDVVKKMIYKKKFKTFTLSLMKCNFSSSSEKSKKDIPLNLSKINIPFLNLKENKQNESKKIASSLSEKDFIDSCKFYQSALQMKGKARVDKLTKSVYHGEAYLKKQTKFQNKKKITFHLILVYQMLNKLKGGIYACALASLIHESVEFNLDDPHTYCLGAEIYSTNKFYLEEDVREISLKKAAELITKARMLCTPIYMKRNPGIVDKIKKLNLKIAQALFT